mmetsp:Transcript_111168/g.313703  ORF Transcript_111168/g.313703 Transcript_111168/m.313703 type:complete len:203 (+) Transcript_111168:377-985(+)
MRRFSAKVTRANTLMGGHRVPKTMAMTMLMVKRTLREPMPWQSWSSGSDWSLAISSSNIPLCERYLDSCAYLVNAMEWIAHCSTKKFMWKCVAYGKVSTTTLKTELVLATKAAMKAPRFWPTAVTTTTKTSWIQKYHICSSRCAKAMALSVKKHRNMLIKKVGSMATMTCRPMVGAKAAQRQWSGPMSMALARLVTRTTSGR